MSQPELSKDSEAESGADGWVVRDIDGKPVRVRAGGFADHVFQGIAGSGERAVEAGRMDWTIGYLADLCWMTVPEMRNDIAKILQAEIFNAVNNDRFLISPTFSEVAEVLCGILISTLRNGAGSGGVSARCLDVIRRVIEEKGDTYLDVFDEDIFKPVKRAGLWSVMKEANPELIQLMENTPRWRGLLESHGC